MCGVCVLGAVAFRYTPHPLQRLVRFSEYLLPANRKGANSWWLGDKSILPISTENPLC